MKNLAEYRAGHASFFERLRFEHWQEPTTDSVRKVCWVYRFPAFELPDNNNPDEPTAPFLLVLSVDYDLCVLEEHPAAACNERVVGSFQTTQLIRSGIYVLALEAKARRIGNSP